MYFSGNFCIKSQLTKAGFFHIMHKDEAQSAGVVESKKKGERAFQIFGRHENSAGPAFALLPFGKIGR